MKKIFTFIIILLFWLVSGLLFKYNNNFYSLLNIPNFVLSKTLISIIWFILYICITISITIIINKNNIFKNTDYLYILITNYLSNQLFCFMFFYLKSPFLGMIITVLTLLTSIFLYIETKKLNKTSSYYLIPYILFNIYSTFMIMFVWLLNF